MAFKMKGSPAKMGMIKGTAGHRSALKAMEEKAAMKAMEKAAAMKAMKEKSAMKAMKEDSPAKAMKKDSPMDFNAKLKQASADGKLSGKFKEAVDASPAKFGPGKEVKDKATKKRNRLKDLKERFPREKAVKATPAKAMKKSPMKEDEKKDIAYGGTVSWKEGMKKSGNRLNNLVAARAKYKKGSAEYNEIQNEINKSLGSKVRRTTKDESGKEVLPKNTKKTTIVDDKGTKDKSDDTTKTETKVKGLGRKKDKTLTFTEKEAEKAKLDKLKKEKKGAETKLDKLEAKKKIADVKSGKDDAKTGTVFSRAYNKLRAKNISKKIEREKNKNKS
tara:strand:+ start:10 stop:1005 length:996 start_codon:yes stop_codon:yes gene_type:complete